MAYCLLQAALLMALIASTLAAVAIGRPDINPDYPNMCWVARARKAYAAGEEWQEPYCTRALCVQDRPGLSIEYASCGVMGDAPPGCKKVQDMSLPYPNCCPTLSCDKAEASKGKKKGGWIYSLSGKHIRSV